MATLYGPMYKRALADASTCTWTGATSSDWGTASNWANSGYCDGSTKVPGSAQNIAFAATTGAKNDLVLTANQTVTAISSPAGFDKTFNTNNYSLQVNGAFTWQAGTLTAGASEITITGDVAMTGGTFNRNTSVFALAGGASNLDSSQTFAELKINKDTSSTAVTLVNHDLYAASTINLVKGKTNSASQKMHLSSYGFVNISGDFGGGTAELLVDATTGFTRIVASGGIAPDTITVTGTPMTWYGTAKVKKIDVQNGAGFTINGYEKGGFIFDSSDPNGFTCAGTGAFTATGSVNSPVIFRSSNPGSQWQFTPSTCTMNLNYVLIKDSKNNSTPQTISYGMDGGNNTGFTFTNAMPKIKWIGGVVGHENDWSWGPNWEGGTAPGSGDVAYFDSSSAVNCSLTAGSSANNIISIDYSGTFNTNNMTFTGDIHWYSGNLAFGTSNLSVHYLALLGDGLDAGQSTLTLTAWAGAPGIFFTKNYQYYNMIANAANSSVSYAGYSTVTNSFTQNYTFDRYSSDEINISGNLVIGSTANGGSAVINWTKVGDESWSTSSGKAANIKFNSNRTVTLGATSSFARIKISQGTLDVSDSNYNITTGSFTNLSTFNARAGTLTFNATGTWIPGSGNYNAVTFGTGSNIVVTTSGTANVAGTLTLNYGTNGGGLAGGIINLASSNLIGTAGTQGSNLGGTQINWTAAPTSWTAGSAIYPHLKFNTTGVTTTLAGNLSAVVVEVASGVLNASSFDITVIAYSLTEGPAFNVSATASNSYVPGTGTLIFAPLSCGAGAFWSQSNSATATYYNVTMNNCDSSGYQLNLVAGITYTVANDFVIYPSAQPLNSGTINVGGNLTFTHSGGGTTAFTLNGTGIQTVTLPSGTDTIPGTTLTINKPSGKAVFTTAAGTGNINNNIALTSGTLEFDGADDDIYTMTAGKTITTSAGTILRFAGVDDTHRVNITGAGTWNIANSGKTYANWVEVDNSHATSTIYAMNSQAGAIGSNEGWDFTSTAKTWVGGTDLLWNTGANWDPAGAPDANDTVTINKTDGALTVTASGTAINFGTLTVGGTTNNTNTLILDANSTPANPIIGSGGDIIIDDDGTLEQKNAVEQTVTGNISIDGSASHLANLTHTANTTAEAYKVIFKTANNVTVGIYGKIDVWEDGYGYNNGPGHGSFSASSYGGKGAGSGTPGPTYGSLTAPVNLGSGGYDHHGGGAVILTVTGLSSLSGTVSANGGNSTGGASGGSIYLTTSTITGSPTITANGGTGVTGGGGGGGGRIAVILTGTSADFSSFTPTTLSAYGGSGTGGPNGGAGTVYKQTATQAGGHGVVKIDNNNLAYNTNTGAGGVATAIPSGQEWNFNTMMTLVLGHAGILDVATGSTLDLNAANITSDTTATGIRLSGGTFNPTLTSGTFTITSGWSLIVDTPYTFGYNLTIASGGNLTHSANSSTETYKLIVTVGGNLTVAGTINVNEYGFSNGNGPGHGSFSASSYGGKGAGSGTPGPTYGSLTAPVNLGSGGYDHHGGGAVILTVTGLSSLSGAISANGGTSTGGASGGSIYLTTSTISGSPTITANGGNGSGAGGSGGSGGSGGGRIAVILTGTSADFSSFTPAVLSAYGGTAGSSGLNGGAGTIYKQTADQTNRTLLVDNQNTVTSGPITTLYGNGANCTGSCLTQATTFDSVSITNRGKLQLVGTQTLNTTGDLTVAANSELQYATDNDGTPAAGAWPTVNVSGNMTVNGSVSSTGLGFIHDAGPGKGGVGTNNGAGAGFGAAGGVSSDGGTAGPAYGSDQDIAYIGSGGGSAQGGSGGGHIELNVTGTLSVPAGGTIAANGNAGTTSAPVNGGGGSGGAIYIKVDTSTTITDNNAIQATGGNGIAAQSGAGSGGRVFLITGGTQVPTAKINVAGGSIGYALGGEGSKLSQTKPVTPTVSSPADAATNQSQTPGISFSTTDSDGDYLRYKVELSTSENFAWYNASWSYRQKVTIDHTKVTADQTDFPVLIKITDAANPIFTSKAQNDGDDLLFTSTDGTTKLSHEIETFSKGTPELWSWVKVPSLSSSTDTILYLYYGNAAATSQQNKTDVWSNDYVGVWHMNNNNWLDSTANSYSLSAFGNPISNGASKIGNGAVFSGETGQYLKTNSSNLLANDSSWTVQAWLNTSTGATQVVGKNHTFWFAANTAPGVWMRLIDQGIEFSSNTDLYPAFLTVTQSGARTVDVYSNGSKKGTQTSASNVTSAAGAAFTMSRRSDDPGASGITGWEDEVRISSETRSATWISTEYANQNTPDSFYSFGSEVNGSTAAVSSFPQSTGSQTITSNGLTATYTGQNGAGSPAGTGYASGATATLTLDPSTPLIQNTTYYYRVSAMDPEGYGGYGEGDNWTSWSTTRSFTIAPIDKTFIIAGTTQIKNAGVCSAIVTFETRNHIDETVKLLAGTAFNLTDGGASGNFYADAACSGGAITNKTITAGSSSTSFYYKNTHSSQSVYTITIMDNPPGSTDWEDGSTTIQINPQVLDHYTMTGYPTARTTDQFFPDPVIVTAFDQYNNVKFDYYGATAQIWFTTTTDSYSYPPDLPAKAASKYTFVSGDNGVKSFAGAGFRLKKVGSQTMTLNHAAYDQKILNQIAITSDAIAISPGEAFDFSLESYPNSTPDWSRYVVSGSTWDIGGVGSPYSPKVTVKDQFNNTKTNYTDRKVWFELYTSVDPDVTGVCSFSYADEGTAYTMTGGDAGIHTFNPTDFMCESSGRNLHLRVRNETIHRDFLIYIKPLGLDHFTIETNTTLAYDSVSYDQPADGLWQTNGTPATVTITAFDVLGYVKTNYGFDQTDESHKNGEGYIYFWSPDRNAYDADGNYYTNQEFPYYRKDATETTHCLPFPASAAGTYTFSPDTEVFQFLKGGRRKVYVSECITPDSVYATDNLIKDSHLPNALWDSRNNEVKTGVFPIANPPDTIATTTHQPGSTHTIDAHISDANDNFTVGPGDQKLSLSWQNPFDAPTGTDTKIYIYQSTNGVDYSLLGSSFRPTVNGAGQWQSQEVTGLENERHYWFKLRLSYRRSAGTELLSDYSIVQDGFPKEIAPVDVTAVQLDRTDPDHPGQVKVDYKLRFESAVSFSYFNPANLSWNLISDSAVSGDKGTISGNFNNPIQHTTYLEMNTDFEGQYLQSSFKARVNVTVINQGSSNSESPTMRLDTKNPTSATLVIDATNLSIANLTIAATDDSTPMQMMISNSPTFDGAVFDYYAASKTNYDISGATTVYIKFRDLYYNDTVIHTDIRPVPASFQIKDASNITTGKYRLITIWDDAVGVNHYNLWRSIDGTNYTQINEQIIKNAFVDINLDSSITYAYKITSEDANGNISLPAGPVSARPGSAPAVNQDPTVELYGWKQDQGVRARITWNTDQLSDSNIAYSTGVLHAGSDNTTDGGSIVKINTLPDMTTSHEIWLYNLEPQTKYYFKAYSQNEIKIAGYSNVLSFTTPEKIALLVSGMKISDITMTSALVNWETSKAATTVLEYGPSTAYGKTLTDSNFNINHTFKLENLTSGVEYNVRAKVTDSDGNTTISDNYTFDVPAMPIVSGVSVGETTFDTATINWSTNVNTDSNVEYSGGGNGSNSSNGSNKSNLTNTTEPTKSGSGPSISSGQGMQGKADSTTVHSVTLIGLEAKTTYSFRALSKDKFGNSAESSGGSFTTASDTQAPKVSNVQAEVSSTGSGATVKYQAVISWETDEPATSQIEYSAGISGDYTESTKEDLSLNSTHVVIIPDLKPNSAYHFRIKSADKAGNIGVSDDTSLITPPQEKSLLSIILKSLEDTFSWVGRIREKWGK